MATLEKILPFAEPSNLADPQMAARIHYATKGVMYEIMRLIRYAGVCAVNRESPKIDLDLLRESFQENLADNYSRLENPFKT